MTTRGQALESNFAPVGSDQLPKLRVVLADESLEYMETVLTLLELHEQIDLIGRAATFPETVQLVLNHEPDLLLLDLDMRLANLVVPAVLLSSRNMMKIVGLCVDELVSFSHLDCITGVNVLVHRKRLRQELLSVIGALYRNSRSVNSETCRTRDSPRK